MQTNSERLQPMSELLSAASCSAARGPSEAPAMLRARYGVAVQVCTLPRSA